MYNNTIVLNICHVETRCQISHWTNTLVGPYLERLHTCGHSSLLTYHVMCISGLALIADTKNHFLLGLLNCQITRIAANHSLKSIKVQRKNRSSDRHLDLKHNLQNDSLWHCCLATRQYCKAKGLHQPNVSIKYHCEISTVCYQITDMYCICTCAFAARVKKSLYTRAKVIIPLCLYTSMKNCCNSMLHNVNSIKNHVFHTNYKWHIIHTYLITSCEKTKFVEY